MNDKNIQRSSILVVEDDGDLGEAVECILQEEGFEVARAGNGREALDLLQDEDVGFCAILLDVRMPVMDGLEFRRRQVADPRIARIPVVAFAADPRERAQMALLGVQWTLSKPVRLEELLEPLDHLCPDRRPEGRLRSAAM